MKENFLTISTAIKQAMQEFNIPGVALGIYHDEQRFTAGFGVTSLDSPIPVTSKTLFQIASISKTYTSTLIMRLVEAGKLSLDTPIKNYIPELKLKDQNAEAKLTLRHILTHTAGFSGDSCVFKDFGMGEDALSKLIGSLAEIAQVFPIGSLVSYNNAGFSIAGYVIARIFNQPFETIMQEWLFKPLGLNYSYFFFQDFFMHSYAVPYEENDEGQLEPAKIWGCGRAANPAGGIITNVDDLLRYAEFHLKKGLTYSEEQALSAEKIQMMQDEQVQLNAECAIGLSWMIEHIDGVKVISHGGGVPGQVTYLMLIPSEKAALVLMTNTRNGLKLIEKIKPLFNQTYFGLSKKQDPIKAITLEDRLEYIGQYSDAEGHIIHDIKLHGDHLALQVTLTAEAQKLSNKTEFPLLNMKFLGHDRWCLFEEETRLNTIEFVRDEQGQVAWLSVGRLLKKISSYSSSL